MAEIHLSEVAPIRITVIDRSKIVTMPGDTLLTRQLVAACASDPETLEDMLLAAEPLRPGITRRIINALLRFDRTMRSDPKIGALRLDPTRDVFEVLNNRLRTLAFQGLPGGLALYDLKEKIIYSAAPSLYLEGSELKREDELPVVENGQLTRKTITYSLDKNWRVVDLAAPPEFLAAIYSARPARKGRSADNWE